MDSAKKRLGSSNYLINNCSKQKNFFKHNYESHSNFTRYTKKLNFNNNFDFGMLSSVKLNEEGSYGDIITNLVISFELPDISSLLTTGGRKVRYSNSIGISLFETVELYIGGNMIDRQTPEMIDILSETHFNTHIRNNFDNLVGKFETDDFDENTNTSGRFYLPLQFWFCRTNVDKQFNLPMFLLYNDLIELRCKMKTFNQVVTNADFNTTDSLGTTLQISNPNIIVEYILLDEKERKRMLELSMKETQFFLINQVQKIQVSVPANSGSFKIELKQLKYLITQLFWIYKSDNKVASGRHLNYNYNDSNPLNTVQITFEKQDATDKQDANYFVLVEPYLNKLNNPRKYIHTFSFSIDPKMLEQPNGVCNFSEIHNPEIDISFVDNVPVGTLQIYAINYNVLQIRNGKGVLFHNLSKSIKGSLNSNPQ